MCVCVCNDFHWCPATLLWQFRVTAGADTHRKHSTSVLGCSGVLIRVWCVRCRWRGEELRRSLHQGRHHTHTHTQDGSGVVFAIVYPAARVPKQTLARPCPRTHKTALDARAPHSRSHPKQINLLDNWITLLRHMSTSSTHIYNGLCCQAPCAACQYNLYWRAQLAIFIETWEANTHTKKRNETEKQTNQHAHV